MNEYAPLGSTQIDPRVLTQFNAGDTPNASTDDSNSFVKGIRSGVTSAGGALNAVAGRVGETLGANDFAARQYAASEAAQKQAALEAPEINDWKQVHGIRDAGSYVAGQLGESLPLVGAAAAAGALAPLAAPALGIGAGTAGFLGATAATAPFTVGGSIQRTQADPNMAGVPLANRNLADIGGGVTSAALMSALPAVAGGKLFGAAEGSAIQNAVARRAAFAGHMAENTVGQGLASASSTGVEQATGSYLAPNRDTSHDNQDMLNAGIGGAVVGAPLGLAHVGLLRGGIGSVNPELGNVKPATFDTFKDDHQKTSDLANVGPTPLDLSNPAIEDPKDIAAGKTPVDQYAHHLGDDSDLNNIIDKHAEDARVEQTSAMKEGILNDSSMTDADKSAIADADPTQREGQMAIASAQVKRAKIGASINAISQAAETSAKAFSDAFGDKTNSEAGDGLRKVVSDVVMPFLQENRPDLANMPGDTAVKLGDSIRKLAATMSTGVVDQPTVNHLRSVFGDAKLREIIGKVGDAVGAETPEFFDSLKKMRGDYEDYKSLTDVVAGASKLPGDPDEQTLNTITNGIRQHVNESAYTGMGPAERTEAKANFEDNLKKLFGDKSEAVLEEFANRNAKADVNSTDMTSRGPETDDAETKDSDQFHADGSPVGQSEAEDTTSYHGSNSKLAPGYMDSTEDHVAKYGESKSPIDNTVERVSRMYPNKIVDKVPFEQLNPEVQAKYPGGEGKQIVRASGTRQEGDITPDDLSRVRVDTTKTSYRNNDASHIQAGGVTVDARKLLLEGQRRMLPDGTPNGLYVEPSTGRESGLARRADIIKQNLAKIEALTGKKTVIDPETEIGQGAKWKDVEKLKTIPKGSGEFENKYDGMTAQQLDNAEGKLQDQANDLFRKKDPKSQYELKQVMREIDSVSKQRELIEKGSAKERSVGERGDVDPLGQVHDAANVHGDDGLAMKEDFSQQPLSAARPKKGPDVLRVKIDNALSRLENFKSPLKGSTELAQDLHDKVSQLLGNLVPDDKVQNLTGTMRRDRSALLKAVTESKTLKELQNVVDPMFKSYERDLTGERYEPGQTNEINDVKAQELPGVKQPVSEMSDKALDAHRNRIDDQLAAAVPGSPETKTLEKDKARASDEYSDRLVDKLVDKTLDATAEKVAASDAKTVSDVINKLNKRGDTKAAYKVNEKVMNKLAEDKAGEVAYSAMKGGSLEVPKDMQAQVKNYIKKVLGPDVVTEFAKMFHEGAYQRVVDNTSGKAHDFIKMSMHSLDPMGTAFHESLHGFMQHMRENDVEGVNHSLFKAAGSRDVIEQLNTLLKDHPDALKQIENSPEERAAYMYQFYRSGDLKLGVAPRNIIQKIGDFIHKTLGIWSNNERAMHIMDYLHSGEFAGDRSTAPNLSDVLNNKLNNRLLKSGQNEFYNRVRDVVAPGLRVATALAGSGDAVLRDLNNRGVNKVLDKVLSRGYEKNDDHGFIPAAREEKTAIMNRLADKMQELNLTDTHTGEALHALQTQTDAPTPEARLLVRHVKDMLKQVDAYSKKAGVDYGDRFTKDGNYFPGVWDSNYIASNQKAFTDMLSKYNRSGAFFGDPHETMLGIISNDGNEFGVDSNAVKSSRPGFSNAKMRSLSFISPEDRAKFSNKDLLGTLNNYVTQATKRAEWTRRFGDENSVLNEHIEEALKSGASVRDIVDLNTYLDGIKGTRGADINPGLRKINSGMMVYQNLVKLPLAVFSLAADPLGIAIRSGHIADAFGALKRGIAETRKNFTDVKDDEWTAVAKNVGTIDHATLVHALGSAFSGGMMGDYATKVNNTFFKYNLVEQMNTSMRTAATQSAFGFLSRHTDGSGTHSTRWLSELGLKPNEMIIKDGHPLYTKEEFLAHGMSDQEATEASLKMRGAINKYVDGAVLRPNAAHKPGWMNDPHYAVFAHLKQFVYSFQETTLKRVGNEIAHGNYTPALALAGYIPTMMAADAIKGALLTGGSQPAYKDSWGAEDYLENAVERSTMFGTGQFGLDAIKNLKHGGTGLEALAGPTAESAVNGLRTLGGRESFSKFAMDSLPFSSIDKAVSHSELSPDSPYAE